MKKTILMLLLFMFVNNVSKAECKLCSQSIYDSYRATAVETYSYDRTAATLTHIMTSNHIWFTYRVDFIKEKYGECKYDFNWGENSVLTSYWQAFFETEQPQNPSHTKYICLAAVWEAFMNPNNAWILRYGTNTNLLLPFGYLKNQGISFRYSHSENDIYLAPPFYLPPNLNTIQYASNLDKRFGKFNQKIKQNTVLFNQLKEASDVADSTASLRFAAGVGFIDSIGFKDAFEEYGIDKSRSILYIITHHKSDYEWTLCWNYADTDDIDTVYCLSSTSEISEPSTIANLQVSPNPTSNSATLTVDLVTAGNLTITVNNLLGQELLEIHSGFTDAETFTKTFSIETLPKGVYYLRIVHNGNVTVEKVIRK